MESGALFSAAKPTWTAEKNKLFENALARYGEDVPDRWAKIAEAVGSSEGEVKRMYDILLFDISLIESGLWAIPNYEDNEESKKCLRKSVMEEGMRLKELELGAE